MIKFIIIANFYEMRALLPPFFFICSIAVALKSILLIINQSIFIVILKVSLGEIKLMWHWQTHVSIIYRKGCISLNELFTFIIMCKVVNITLTRMKSQEVMRASQEYCRRRNSHIQKTCNHNHRTFSITAYWTNSYLLYSAFCIIGCRTLHNTTSKRDDRVELLICTNAIYWHINRLRN